MKELLIENDGMRELLIENDGMRELLIRWGCLPKIQMHS